MRGKDMELLRNPKLQEIDQHHCHTSKSDAVCKTRHALDLGKVLDLERLLLAVGDDADFLEELYDLFKTSYPDLMKELGLAIQDGDAPRAHTAAHQLKGMVANFAAGNVLALTQEIESLVRKSQLQSVRRLFNDLEREMSRLNTALETLVQFLRN